MLPQAWHMPRFPSLSRRAFLGLCWIAAVQVRSPRWGAKLGEASLGRSEECGERACRHRLSAGGCSMGTRDAARARNSPCRQLFLKPCHTLGGRMSSEGRDLRGSGAPTSWEPGEHPRIPLDLPPCHPSRHGSGLCCSGSAGLAEPGELSLRWRRSAQPAWSTLGCHRTDRQCPNCAPPNGLRLGTPPRLSSLRVTSS